MGWRLKVVRRAKPLIAPPVMGVTWLQKGFEMAEEKDGKSSREKQGRICRNEVVLHLGHLGFSSDEITYKKHLGQPMRLMTLFIIGPFVSLGVFSSVGRKSEISAVKSDV
ncbi:transmembrane protein, putative [Medicago truncatula]|uniref:Transmembrane protein, putative n=1 Tax=Medicago truncatula TaxID=3880 RepID=A0A072UL48_MEDTR|nr:transmembrane protein, putative [Medicago truncatula]